MAQQVVKTESEVDDRTPVENRSITQLRRTACAKVRFVCFSVDYFLIMARGLFFVAILTEHIEFSFQAAKILL